MDPELKRTSKFLSLVLRHDPKSIGLELDEQGWALVSHLLERASAAGQEIEASHLEAVVRLNDKQRFAFSPDGRFIRASQGHSIPVDLGLEAIEPPDKLHHGTATHHIDSIRLEGLRSMKRRQVHLSADRETAVRVGQRHGKAVVLLVDSARMYREGFTFFRSANGVWLTDHVAPEFLDFTDVDRTSPM